MKLGIGIDSIRLAVCIFIIAYTTYRYDAGHNWNEILGPGTGTQEDDENIIFIY